MLPEVGALSVIDFLSQRMPDLQMEHMAELLFLLIAVDPQDGLGALPTMFPR